MLLARAAQRAAPLARARALSSSPAFTLHAFTDSNDFGFGRGAQFCMLNLRHDALFAAAQDPAALYAAKYEARRARIKRLFEKLDSLELGALDRAALSKGLDGIGLPASPERLDRVFERFESGSGNLALAGFEEFLVETWGFPLHVEFSSELGSMGLGGTQAIAWVGRTVPAHFVLRALRQLWPLDVEDIAILRNDSANPDLDPQRMTLHDRTYTPSVGKDTATAGGLARTLLAQDPLDKGGFVVRVATGGDVTYVPLRGLRYSGAKPAAVANPEVSGVEWALRSGLGAVGLGTTLWLGLVILKGG
jgi:hypothetical protein